MVFFLWIFRETRKRKTQVSKSLLQRGHDIGSWLLSALPWGGRCRPLWPFPTVYASLYPTEAS